MRASVKLSYTCAPRSGRRRHTTRRHGTVLIVYVTRQNRGISCGGTHTHTERHKTLRRWASKARSDTKCETKLAPRFREHTHNFACVHPETRANHTHTHSRASARIPHTHTHSVQTAAASIWTMSGCGVRHRCAGVFGQLVSAVFGII